MKRLPRSQRRHPEIFVNQQDVRRSFTSYLAQFTFIAVFISAIAIALVVMAPDTGPLHGTLSDHPGAFAMVVICYFIGALLAAWGMWALQPVRKTVWGWMLTGAVCVMAVYGSAYLGGLALYFGSGINLFDFRSRNDALRSGPLLLAVFGVIGVVVGWYKWMGSEERSRQRELRSSKMAQS